MYLPESHEQMFDILSELRVYAAANQLDGLAEQIDDALIVLVADRWTQRHRIPETCASLDWR